MKHLIIPLAMATALAVSPSAARAGTNSFIVPEFRGAANSESGYWESFTVPFGAPGNIANMAGATTGAVLTQDGSPAAFVTGSGNIYDFSTSIQTFTLTDSTPFTLGTVVLQLRSLGSEFDYGFFTLNYSDGLGTHSLAPLDRIELDRGTTLGASVSSLYQWDLTGLNVNDYSLTFSGAAPSVSFDAMTLDTWNQFTLVPEPSTYALLGLGVVLFRCRKVLQRS